MRARAPLVLSIVVLTALLGACTGNPPPPPVETSPVAKETTSRDSVPSKIVVGIEHIAGGYNPHVLADSSTITSVLATLVLPSVFRPATDGKSSGRVLNTSVMVSAEVTSHDPFTVSYVIRDDASWSDGAPIAAEDFIYLTNAMQTQPGVVNRAGYRLITEIRSSEGGKHVEVEFSRPYPAWRTLFDYLLPAHLLKDSPDGWQKALAGGFPASGGPFTIASIDLARGQIVLERNQRYWANPANVDKIVLRRTSQQNMAAALRSGTIQLALTSPDATGLKLLKQLGDSVRLETLLRGRVASVLLRPSSAELSNEKVRAAVAALLDRAALIAVGTGGGPSAGLRASAQVRAPTDSEYQPTIPPDGVIASGTASEAAQLLREAGYSRSGEKGMWRKNGSTLTLVIATPGNREPFTRIAEAIAGQLAGAGINVRTVHPKPRRLFTDALTTPVGQSGSDGTSESSPGERSIDIAVIPLATGGDTATVLASRFGCPPPSKTAEKDAKTRSVRATAAPYCEADFQQTIRKALTGTIPVSDALAEIESALWSSHVVIPLFQLTDTLAIGAGIKGVDPGLPAAGPFESAAHWKRVPA